MQRSAKKRRVFARIFDITMNIIISGDTNDHRGMRIQERKGGRGGGEKEEMRRYRPRREARMITRSETQKGWPPRRLWLHNSSISRLKSL